MYLTLCKGTSEITLIMVGLSSLDLVYPELKRPSQDFGDQIVQVNVGVEGVADLICDLE